jgi:hypothetical protein
VFSDDGECMQLNRSIPLQKSVEQWLSRLQESVAETIRMDIYSCIKDIDNGFPFEELVSKVFRNKIFIKNIFVVFFLVYMSSIINRIIICLDT